MKIEQLYYTSAKRGIGNGSGFQVYSKSDGITQAETSEIQNLVGYVPPTTLPSRPTEEEILHLFPKSFTFFKLSTGRYGVFQSSYVGKDYSERYGNYFAHVLVFDSKFIPVYPMEYYQSSIFKERLTEEEANSNEMPKPLLTLESIPVNPKLSFDQIVQFLNEGNRLAYFQSMLRSVISNEIAGKRVMIIDEAKYLPYWFAAIHYSFPKGIAHQLTFTTYTHNPDKNPAQICSTWTAGTRFAAGHTRNYPYYLFDFEKQNTTDIELVSTYANYVAEVLKKGESLQPLFSIIQQSNLTAIDQDLDKGVSVLSFMGKGNPYLDDLDQAFEFVHKFGHDSLYTEILNKVSHYWFELNHLQDDLYKLSFEQAYKIAAFLFEGARKTQKKEHIEIAMTFLFDTVDQFMLDAQTLEEIQRVISYYEEFEYASNGFAERAIDSSRLDRLSYLNTEPNIDKMQFYFFSMIKQFCLLEKDWVSLQNNQKQTFYILFYLIMKSKNANKLNVLESLYTIPAIFVRIVSSYYKDLYNRDMDVSMEIEQIFQPILVKIEEDGNSSANPLKMLAKDEFGRKLLVNSMANKFEYTERPIQLFEKYYQNLFMNNPSMDSEVKILVEKIVNNMMKSGKQEEQIVQVLQSVLLPYMANSQLQHIVEEYEETLNFSYFNETKADEIESIIWIKRENGIKTKSKILILIDFTLKLKNGGKPAVESEAEVARILNTFSTSKYKEYIEWSLPFYLTPGLKEKERIQVIKTLSASNMKVVFWNVLAKHQGIEKKLQVECMHTFLLYVYSKRSKEEMAEENSRLDEAVVRYFQQNKSEYKKINELMLAHPHYKMSLIVKNGWENTKGKMTGKGKHSQSKDSLFSKIKKLF